MNTRAELIKAFKAEMATLPATRDLVHRCFICGAKEERWHSHTTEAGAVREYTHCDGCGRAQTLHIGWAK